MESTLLPVLVRILMIGESSVGKTSLVLRYDDHGFNSKFTTTIGVDYSDRLIAIEGRQIKLQIWDTAGQERFHSLTTSFFKRADGFALVFDVSDRQTFESVSRWMRDIREYGKPDSSVVLVGNKCDIKARDVTETEAAKLASQYSISYFESSAKENVNVSHMFESLALSIKRRHDETTSRAIERKESTMKLVPKEEVDPQLHLCC